MIFQISQSQEFITNVASIITAVGIIGGAYAVFWKHLAKKVVHDGIKKIRREDLTENEFFQQLEAKDREIIDKLDSIAEGVQTIDHLTKKNTISIKRQELLFIIQTEPHRVETIERIYSEYIEMGGNSYISDLITVWRENHARPEIKDRISTKQPTKPRKRTNTTRKK